MWIFVSILFLIGTLQFLLNLSMIRDNWLRLLPVFINSLGVFALYPFSTRINAGQFTAFINDYNLLSLACTVQVLESLAVLIFTGIFIKHRTEEIKVPVWSYLSFFPSPIFLAGLFMIQTGVLHVVNGMSFGRVSFSVAFFIFLILVLGGHLTRFITESDDSRMELKIYFSLMQLLLAMFLPVTIGGGSIKASQFEIGFLHTLSVWVCMIAIGVAGFYLTRLKIRIVPTLRDHLTKLFISGNIADEKS